MIDLRSFGKKDISSLMEEMSEPHFRSSQVFQWVHKHGVNSIEEMSNLPKELRRKLKSRAYINLPRIIGREVSDFDKTCKFLLEFSDGEIVETVVMPHGSREKGSCTVCVSTQIGCAVGCDFCATGRSGFERDLTAGEIISQVLAADKEARVLTGNAAGVTNVVFMGMGEPLFNYESLLKAVKIINDPLGQNISQRKIVISTAGYVPGIKRLAQEKLQIVLAVSLQAAENKVRDLLVPLNKQYPLERISEACEYYTKLTGRRITFEYVMIKDINDDKRSAGKLAEFVYTLLANVNVIPFNSVGDSAYEAPDEKRINIFVSELKRRNVEAVIRRERGADIEGACGQLRCRKQQR